MSEIETVDIEAERIVLANTILNHFEVWPDVSRLKPDHFHSASYAQAWRVLLEMRANGEPVDVSTFVSRIPSMAKEATAFTRYDAPMNVPRYVEKIEKLAMFRRVQGALRAMTPDNAPDVLENIRLNVLPADRQTLDPKPLSIDDFAVKPTPLACTLRRRTMRQESAYLEPYLLRGDVAAIVGQGGVGKTQMALQLALSVATGAPVFDGMPSPDEPSRALVLLGETSDDRLRRRLWPLRERLATMSPDRLSNFESAALRGRECAFIEPKGYREGWRTTTFFRKLHARLERESKRRPYGLIVLEPASRFAGPEAETDNAAATAFIAALEQLTQLPGEPTVLVCHHVNKGAVKADGKATLFDQTAARGSSAFVDGCRWVANMAELDPEDHLGMVGLNVVKANDVAKGLPMVFQRAPDSAVLRYHCEWEGWKEGAEPKPRRLEEKGHRYDF